VCLQPKITYLHNFAVFILKYAKLKDGKKLFFILLFSNVINEIQRTYQNTAGFWDYLEFLATRNSKLF